MERIYLEALHFEKKDFSQDTLTLGDYEECTFVDCNFSNADISNIHFVECVFDHCNFSVTKLTKTSFRDIKFKDCKLQGLHFEDCNQFLFTVEFENCMLLLSSFYKLNLKKTKFKNSGFKEADFTEADLTDALFDNCNLAGATFENTIIEKADFRTSFNYSIDPESNRVKKAKFSIAGIAGLLEKYDIIIE